VEESALNGVGAATVQGLFAVKAAEKLQCGSECGDNTALTVVNNMNANLSVPCNGDCN
jgi:hypothetical protein